MSELIPSKREIRQRVEYGALVLAQRLAVLTRKSQLEWWEHGFAKLAYQRLKIYRKVVEPNLRIAFANWAEEDRVQLAYENYRWFARFTLDLLRMSDWIGRTESICEVRNPEILREALAEERGVLLASGHFGNWEIICPRLAEVGFPMSLYVGAQTNPRSDDNQNTLRASFGVETIGRSRQAPLRIRRALEKNRAVTIIVDQNDNKSDLFVDFFGKAASMSKGLGSFHYLKQSPVLFTTCTYQGDRCLLEFQRLECPHSGDKERDLQHMSQAFTTAMEAAICRHPEQYFWMHRRWRKRPAYDPQPVY